MQRWQNQDERELFWEVVGELIFCDIPYVASVSGVTAKTLYRWIDMEVLHPRWNTLSKTARALGFQLRYRKSPATAAKFQRQRARIRRAA